MTSRHLKKNIYQDKKLLKKYFCAFNCDMKSHKTIMPSLLSYTVTAHYSCSSAFPLQNSNVHDTCTRNRRDHETSLKRAIDEGNAIVSHVGNHKQLRARTERRKTTPVFCCHKFSDDHCYCYKKEFVFI